MVDRSKPSYRIRFQVGVIGRTCTFCRLFKKWREFGTNKHGINGHTPRCRLCLAQDRQAVRAGSYTKRKVVKVEEPVKVEVVMPKPPSSKYDRPLTKINADEFYGGLLKEEAK